MKKSISFLFISLIILNLISNYYVISEEVEKEKTKTPKNMEENDEFDDPTLLKKDKKKKKKEKPNSTPEDKKPQTPQDNDNDKDNDNMYPTVEQLRQEKMEEMIIL